MNHAKWREVWIGVAAAVCINAVLFFIPNFRWYVWALQLVYLIPATAVLMAMKRRYLVGALWIVGGATLLLDLALCGQGIAAP